jgi:hypothetical protein
VRRQPGNGLPVRYIRTPRCPGLQRQSLPPIISQDTQDRDDHEPEELRMFETKHEMNFGIWILEFRFSNCGLRILDWGLSSGFMQFLFLRDHKDEMDFEFRSQRR